MTLINKIIKNCFKFKTIILIDSINRFIEILSIFGFCCWNHKQLMEHTTLTDITSFKLCDKLIIRCPRTVSDLVLLVELHFYIHKLQVKFIYANSINITNTEKSI